MLNLSHFFLGNESCCTGLLLCMLAMLNKPRWEKVITGDSDLFPKGPTDSQIISERILDCLAKKSCEPLTTLLIDNADPKKECDSKHIILGDQAVSSVATFDNRIPTEQVLAGSANKEKKCLAAVSNCKSAEHERFWISSCTKTVKEFEKRY